MKQFQYMNPRSGNTFGPYTEDVVRTFRQGVHAALSLGAGETWTDADGDVWSRVDVEPAKPDSTWTSAMTDAHNAAVLAEQGAAMSLAAQQAERLERITLSYLQVLGPAYASGQLLPNEGETLSSVCVAHARALIDKLDEAK